MAPFPHELPSRRSLLGRAAGLGGALSLGAWAAGCAAPGEGSPSAAQADARERADELLAGLRDQSGSLEPIRPEERAARRARLGELLAQRGLDALLCEGGATMSYLAGVAWGHSERFFGLVVLADGSHFWIVPAFEEGRARLSIDAPDGPGGAVVPWDEHEYAFAPLAAALRQRRVERVAIEPALRQRFVEGLAEKLGAERIASGLALVVELRGRKDAHELALLRRANELTQEAILAVSRVLRPGLRGREIRALLGRAHERLGMTQPWCLALIGPEAALPHGGLDELALERGSPLLVDTGAALHGYQSDETRTWIFDGAPSATLERAWWCVRDAQQRAFEAIRPGVECRAIDAAARAVIAAGGWGEGYRALTHRLGHGIGLEGHEDPYFDGGSAVVLAPGMTLSNEPGIYVQGSFGVRLEDVIAVDERGAEHFGRWQRDPRDPSGA